MKLIAMANPQPDEFTRISNELLEAILLSNFTKRQLNIILLAIRLSYGCGRKYAILRKSDFEIAGIDKSDIKKELDVLVRSGVLVIDGDRIGLNKDYDRWRISLVRAGSKEELKKILQRNLEEKKVGILPTDQCDQVDKIPTGKLVKYQLGGWQNTNQVVGKTPTDQDTQSNGANGSGSAERNIKETLKKSKENPPYNPPQVGSERLKNLFAVPAEKQGDGAQLNAGKEINLPAERLPCRAQEREGAKTAPGISKEKQPAPTVGNVPGNDGEYDQDFLRFWAEYPKKHEKKRAYRCWQTRIKEGVPAGNLITAAKNYAADCQKRRTEEQYIKHASTFLGPDKPYLDWITKPEAKREEKEKEIRKELIKSLYLN